MTCQVSPTGSHHWLLPEGFQVTGRCCYCGHTRAFTNTLLPKVTLPKRLEADIIADAYAMGLAMRLARDSGCVVDSFYMRGGRT